MSHERRTRHAAYGALLALVACAADDATPESAPVASNPPATPSRGEGTSPSSDGESSAPAPFPTADQPVLKVRFLGVQGFVVEVGNDALLTAPLFTRPNGFSVTTGLPVTADPSLVAKNLPSSTLTNIRAILSGHAHYDHLLDTPNVMARAPNATLFSNRSARNLLAAYAPDRSAKCAGNAAPADTILRTRVVAVDDDLASVLDWNNCLDNKPASAPTDGKWLPVPGATLRVLAVCSEHQAQIGPVHFGEGDVVEEQCAPPKNMKEWKEGVTVGFLVDFLEPKTKTPVFRVYYEDSPAGATKGQVPARFLAERRIDLAIACVGSYGAVAGAPGNTLSSMNPRFALGGHWEDFLVAADQPPKPLPFLDPADWDAKAKAAMPPSGEAKRMLQNGTTLAERVVRPMPGDTFEIR